MSPQSLQTVLCLFWTLVCPDVWAPLPNILRPKSSPFNYLLLFLLKKKTQDQDMKTKPNISINVTSVFLIN